MSSIADGVKFDVFGDGQPFKISWPEADSNDGWLVLPDKDGRVTNFSQFFGNLTPQPPNLHPNGFAALAVYDANNDGVINSKDSIWQQLRVWVDNHPRDGIAQSEELLTLDEVGISAISIDSRFDPVTDQYGNVFGLKGACSLAGSSRAIWDVWLQ